MTELLDWSEPIKTFSPEGWVDECIPHYRIILGWMERIRQDPMGAEDYESACALLDLHPGPADLDEANARWRRFVAAICNCVKNHRVRLQRQREARAVRRRAKTMI